MMGGAAARRHPEQVPRKLHFHRFGKDAERLF